MNWNQKENERGFTLLEILAVLTLLAFILTMVAPNIIKNLNKGKRDAAVAQVNALKSVLNTYYIDNSSYPSTEQGLKALTEKPAQPPVPENWNGPYLEDGKIPKDPWGRELHYKSPGTHNPEKFDVFSLGRDNAEGGTGDDADVGNW